MVEPPVPLTALSEDQRAQAYTRFTIIRPALEDGITQAQVARTHNISKSTIGRWVKRYREQGLNGLAGAIARSDKGTSRRLSSEAITLIEGLALQTPPRTIAAIHRQVCTIARARGWNVPSYDSVYRIIKKLDPALLTLAHQGAAAYREEYDLLYRREATHAMWQADHSELPILLLDEAGKPKKPWLTVIGDDYSRAIVGYRLSFQEATALTTALTLRTAIWRKEDPLYWLLGTSVQEKTDLACPITIIPGHGTRLRDKGNLFFSLSERGKLHQARTTDPFWQHALRKTIWMPSERSSFEGIWTTDDGTLAQLDPLMHGRLRWILFTPPIGSHGAVRPRSE